MKILKKILIAVLLLVAVVLVIGFFSPRNVTLERSITINASASSVYEEINGLTNFNKWSPWAKIDPENTDYTYEGPETGVGSKMTWSSTNSDVGKGSQEIVEAVENERIKTEMFFEDYPDANYASFMIVSEGESSTVTWNFEGDMGSNPIGKLMGRFMESMLGPSYEEGLQNLKALVEAKPTYGIDISVQNVEPITYLAIKYNFDVTDPDAIGPKMGELYGKVGAFMGANNIQFTGMPFTVYNEVSETTWNADVAIPCNTDGVSPKGDIIAGSTTGGKVIKGIHLGDYHKLDASHADVAKYMEYKGLEASGKPYEIYVTDPSQEADTAKWLTEVYYPVKL